MWENKWESHQKNFCAIRWREPCSVGRGGMKEGKMIILGILNVLERGVNIANHKQGKDPPQHFDLEIVDVPNWEWSIHPSIFIDIYKEAKIWIYSQRCVFYFDKIKHSFVILQNTASYHERGDTSDFLNHSNYFLISFQWQHCVREITPDASQWTFIFVSSLLLQLHLRLVERWHLSNFHIQSRKKKTKKYCSSISPYLSHSS